ncbi:MAG: hypothetical protein ACOX19_07035 [Fermentimonas sp.]|jgi:hypothetical protein
MIAKKSELILESFVILESDIKFNVPQNNEKLDINETLNSYPVNIDFNIQHSLSIELYRVVVSIDINADFETPKPGYSIKLMGIGFFKFDEASQLTEQNKAQMLQTSALSICITNLRFYIANQTSYFPWGSFSFHAIDVQDLLMKKTELTSEECE